MPITRTPIIDDDGTGTTGTVIDNAWKTELYGQIDQAAGVWTNVTFTPANYTASSGVWTVPAGFQQTLHYLVMPGSRLVVVTFSLGGTVTLSASTVSLLIACPGMPAASAIATQNPFAYWIQPGLGTGLADIAAGSSGLRLIRDIAGTAWAAQTAAIMYLQGALVYSY